MEGKDEKQKMLREKKIIAVQREYGNALAFIEMYYSQLCWKDAAQVRRCFLRRREKNTKLKAANSYPAIRSVGQKRGKKPVN